jgi:hypothetical protein
VTCLARLLFSLPISGQDCKPCYVYKCTSAKYRCSRARDSQKIQQAKADRSAAKDTPYAQAPKFCAGTMSRTLGHSLYRIQRMSHVQRRQCARNHSHSRCVNRMFSLGTIALRSSQHVQPGRYCTPKYRARSMKFSPPMMLLANRIATVVQYAICTHHLSQAQNQNRPQSTQDIYQIPVFLIVVLCFHLGCCQNGRMSGAETKLQSANNQANVNHQTRKLKTTKKKHQNQCLLPSLGDYVRKAHDLAQSPGSE